MASPAALLHAARRPWAVRPGALAAAILPPGRQPTDVIAGAVASVFGDTWPAGALWICAVRLDDGVRVVFGRDARPPVAQAVEASCAIPSFFAPVEIDGARYVDGGVHSPTNADLLAGLGLDLVVVSSPMSSAGRRLTMTPDLAIRRYSRLALDGEARRLQRSGTPVIAFQPTADELAVMGVNAMDWRRRGAVVDAARTSVLRRLERPDVRTRLAPLGLR
jgi:NTE family protein